VRRGDGHFKYRVCVPVHTRHVVGRSVIVSDRP